MNPLDWTAGPFLLFYMGLAAAVLLMALLLRSQVGWGRAGDTGPLDVLQVAYLAGGPERAADTALLGLLEHGAVIATPNGIAAARVAPMLPAAFEPYAALAHGASSRTAFLARASQLGAQVRAGLVGRGLAASEQDGFRHLVTVAVLVMIPLLLGLAKVFVGAARGHPVGFLLLLTLATVVIGVLAGQAPVCTMAGAAALRQFRDQHARAARAPLGHELPLAFALTGAAVLAGRPYHSMFVPASSGGGGDGGSSSDSGGGDGGGGCGGCS